MTNYLIHKKEQFLQICGKEPETLDELATFAMKVINEQNFKKCSVVGFAWDLNFGNVRNTHSRPINGVENWSGRDKSLPTSYPGWNGRVWIRYSNDGLPGGGYDPFSATLTYPGTGGGGAYNGPWVNIRNIHYQRYKHTRPVGMYKRPECFSWDYRIYLSDWPAILANVEKQQIIDKLSGKSTSLSHKFLWEDSKQTEEDAAFIAESNMLYRDVEA